MLQLYPNKKKTPKAESLSHFIAENNNHNLISKSTNEEAVLVITVSRDTISATSPEGDPPNGGKFRNILQNLGSKLKWPLPRKSLSFRGGI